MKSRALTTLLAAAISLLAFTTASAQLKMSSGLKTGLSMATVYGDDTRGADMKPGFIGGLVFAFNINDAFAIQPEVLYCQKGTQNEDSSLTIKVKLDYVEIPVLMKLTLPTTGSMRPFLYAGPAFAFKVSAKMGVSSSGSGSVDMDIENVKSTDLGLTVGGGLSFGLSRSRLSLDVRYTRGLQEFADEPSASGINIGSGGVAPNWKHSNLALMLGVYF